MALDDTEKLFIYNLSVQLLSGDYLTNTLFAGGVVGRDLRSMVFSEKKATIFTDPMDEALTGRLRADAATMDVASSNVAEAGYLVDTAESSLETIKSALEDMEMYLEGYIDGAYTQAEAEAAYSDLASQIESIIENASYNGISLFDTDQWATDDRVTVSGDSGQITIQGDGSFTLNLTNLRDDLISDVGGTGESLYEGTEFTNTTTAQAALDDKITPALETITALENIYEERADHLASWADNLSSQADVLELAAENRRVSVSNATAEEALLDYLLTLTGSLLDEDT